MCEQLKKDVLCLSQTPNKIHISHRSTFMQEEIHPDGSHRKDGPSTRLRTFDTRFRNYIFTGVMSVMGAKSDSTRSYTSGTSQCGTSV